MKTDYGKLGQESMDSLRNTSELAADVQRRVLGGIIQRNCNTVYGRKYGFGEIGTAEEYQEKVPLSVYGDYEAYILRMIAGEEKVLTGEPPVYYCISSGTTGDAKYLPLTVADLKIQHTYAYGVPFGMVKAYYRDLPEDEVFGKIFQIGEFAKTYMEKYGNISELADILGHSSINTTRIYLVTTGAEHARQLEKLGLVT